MDGSPYPGTILGTGCTVPDALERISSNKARFHSRSNDPVISAPEKELWNEAGIGVASAPWYFSDRLSEEKALLKANEKGVYTFTFRSSYLGLEQSGAISNMTVYVKGERNLQLSYFVCVNSDQIDSPIHRIANRFAEWLGEETAQSYSVDMVESGNRVSPYMHLLTEKS
jgi:ABC-type tungstate transport system permease subunit